MALILLTGVGVGHAQHKDSALLLQSGDNIVEEMGKKYFEKMARLHPQGSPLYLSSNDAQPRTESSDGEESGGPPRQVGSGNVLATAGGVALLAEQGLVIDGEAGVSEVHTYEVQEGDTISSIAEEFGVGTNTVLWANDLSARSTLREGTRLTILPVDGVQHKVGRGETVSSIAKLYGAEEDSIEDFNDITGGTLSAGKTIIVPGGKKQSAVAPRSTGSSQRATVYSLVDSGGYFLFPARGKITQGLHRYNAVDIGGSAFCNTPLYAAAAGAVVEAGSGWNGGYGKYVRISHSNGTVTLYAHASQLFVAKGASVAKGDVIALMGSTGNSTGCHVHFEVRGARNPFAY